MRFEFHQLDTLDLIITEPKLEEVFRPESYLGVETDVTN